MAVLEEVDQGILQTENVWQVSDMLDVLKLEEKIQHDSRDREPIWHRGVTWRRNFSCLDAPKKHKGKKVTPVTYGHQPG